MCRAVRPVLSIGLLVSNRKDTTQKCLDSLTPIRESIPCELIITDTGCDADMQALLAEYADKQNTFVWCNDFSKARNANLALAEGEWYLFLDDDEWFTSTADIIRFFREDDYNSYSDGVYIQRNYNDAEGTGYTDTWVSRMARITPELHFVSKIHEYLEPLNGNRIGLTSVVDHYGYVFKSEEENQKHFERNSSLLLEMLKEEPENLRWRMQLLQEYKFVAKFDELYALAVESMAHIPAHPDINERNALVCFYAAMILALDNRKQYGEEYDCCVKAERDRRSTEMGQAFFALYKADACAHLGKWNEAAAGIAVYFERKRFFDSNQVVALVQSTPPFVGKSFAEGRLRMAHSIAALAALKRKKPAGLAEHIRNLQWDGTSLYLYDGLVDELLLAMCRGQTAKEADELAKVLQILYNNNYLWRVVCENCVTEASEGTALPAPFHKLLVRIGACEEVQSFLAMRQAQQRLSEPAGMSLASIRESFAQFSASGIDFYEKHYGSSIWEGEPESLEPEAQAALWINLALEQETQSPSQFLACLKQCIHVYPELAEGVRTWLAAWQAQWSEKND
jgi:glycosyltransferase involved in cell wall biosynthesis